MFSTKGGRVVHQALEECSQKGKTELKLRGLKIENK